MVDGGHQLVEELVGNAGLLELGEEVLGAVVVRHDPGVGDRFHPGRDVHAEVDGAQLLVDVDGHTHLALTGRDDPTPSILTDLVGKADRPPGQVPCVADEGHDVLRAGGDGDGPGVAAHLAILLTTGVSHRQEDSTGTGDGV